MFYLTKILNCFLNFFSDGKKKGFAFVEFNNTKSMIKAMKELNFKKIHGMYVNTLMHSFLSNDTCIGQCHLFLKC